MMLMIRYFLRLSSVMVVEVAAAIKKKRRQQSYPREERWPVEEYASCFHGQQVPVRKICCCCYCCCCCYVAGRNVVVVVVVVHPHIHHFHCRRRQMGTGTAAVTTWRFFLSLSPLVSFSAFFLRAGFDCKLGNTRK